MVTMDSAQRFLREVLAEPRCSRLTDVKIICGDRVLAEYSATGGAPQDLFSLTKTVLTVLTGMAVDRLSRPGHARR